MANTSQWNGGGSGNTALPRSVSATTLGYDAYRELGVSRAGQTVSPEMIDDARNTLNDMVDSWNTERLSVYAIARTVYDLTAGQTSFSLGDQEETGTRPVRVVGAALMSAGSTSERDIPLLTLNQHRGGLSGFYTDQDYPSAAVTITAASAGDQLVIYGWKPLQGFDDLDTLYSFPPGYASALKWGLALELAPSARIYAKIPDVLYAHIQANAAKAIGNIKRENAPTMIARCPQINRFGYYDILSGGFVR